MQVLVVLVNGMTYRRNRRQLIAALPEASECELEQTAGQDEEQEQPTNHLPDNRHDDTELLPLGRHTGTQSAADFESATAVSQPGGNTSEVTKPSGEPPLRRSERLRKKPDRYGQSSFFFWLLLFILWCVKRKECMIEKNCMCCFPCSLFFLFRQEGRCNEIDWCNAGGVLVYLVRFLMQVFIYLVCYVQL